MRRIFLKIRIKNSKKRVTKDRFLMNLNLPNIRVKNISRKESIKKNKKIKKDKFLKYMNLPKYDWFLIPAATRSAVTVLDPSEAAFLR